MMWIFCRNWTILWKEKNFLKKKSRIFRKHGFQVWIKIFQFFDHLGVSKWIRQQPLLACQEFEWPGGKVVKEFNVHNVHSAMLHIKIDHATNLKSMDFFVKPKIFFQNPWMNFYFGLYKYENFSKKFSLRIQILAVHNS